MHPCETTATKLKAKENREINKTWKGEGAINLINFWPAKRKEFQSN